MKFKTLNNEIDKELTRRSLLHSRYCANPELSVSLFIERIKNSYYKYDARVYNPDYSEEFIQRFADVFLKPFSGVPPVIVDIGAGSGESYRLIRKIGFNYSKYIAIEPFQRMLDNWNDKDDDKLETICEYFESEVCKKKLLHLADPKIYLINNALRTIDNLHEFLENLHAIMNEGDFLILPLEPNNLFFGRYLKFFKPLRVLARLIDRTFNFTKPKIVNTSVFDPLKLATADLRSQSDFSNKITEEIIYAVVYYQNYFCWRHIELPDDYSDGFFTVDWLAERIDAKIVFYETYSYLYPSSSGLIILDKVIDFLCHLILNNNGSHFTAVLRRV